MQKAPTTIGAYSSYRKGDNFLFTSGQLPINPETNQLEDNFVAQCKRSLMNIRAILKKENLEMGDIIKITVLLNDLTNLEDVNKVFVEVFEEPYPARTAYEVAKLPKGALIEIEATAILS